MTALLDQPTHPPAGVTFLELEITQECQLTCSAHCYAQAGPGRGHGRMTGEDWRRVISEAARIGVKKVQLIGGEPTRHPEFTALLRHALDEGLTVQVFSNLFRVRAEHWEAFGDPRVTLGTSYYSDDPAEHDEITGRKGSHASTRANIAEAVRRGIRVKVGIIHLRDGQRSAQALAEMEALGVTRVHIDRVREVGNAAKSTALPSTSELCGRCAKGRAAILPDGTVAPCVLSRFLPTGNVKSGLGTVLTGPQWAEVAASIPRHRADCAPNVCSPSKDSCGPSKGVASNDCNPNQDGEDCSPAEQDACEPSFD